LLNVNVNATIVPPNPAVLKIIDNDPPQPLTCGFLAPSPWKLRNFLPQPVYGAGVANDGAHAYIIGGYTPQSSKDITQTVRYDPAANTWTALAPVPKAVSISSVIYAPVNNKLYVFGGQLVSTGLVYSSTLIYDIASNTWSTGASMPGARAFMSAGYYNGKVYLVGGYSSGSVTPSYSQTWEYNVTANTWTTKTSMPEGLGGAASAVVNGHLYVIGGRDGIIEARNQTYDYDIAHDSWSARANIPYGVNVPGVAVLHDKILVIGGGSPFLTMGGTSTMADANSPQTINTTMIYNPSANSWAAGPNLNVPRSFIGGTGFGDYALAIGGYSSGYATGAAEVIWICPNGYLPVIMKIGP
jgi:N-acetylneuraminic acid mutarotase